MKITYNGHACFSLESNDGIVVFDPYKDGSIPGLNSLDLSGDLILCSHEHFDHNAREVVKQLKRITHIDVETIDCFHDDARGTLRGKNIIHIVKTEDMKVAHLGDLGHELDDYSLLKNVDVLIIPVGGHYTIDSQTAKNIVKAVEPRITIPMHYRGDTFGFDVISTIDGFLEGEEYIDYNESELVITKDTPKQIAYIKAKEIA